MKELGFLGREISFQPMSDGLLLLGDRQLRRHRSLLVLLLTTGDSTISHGNGLYMTFMKSDLKKPTVITYNEQIRGKQS